MVDDTIRPPSLAGPLAKWFAEAVREELTVLEKSGGAQSYEVHSGSLLQTIGAATAIFQFIIADGTRIPEDASGRLKTDDADYAASVLRQIGDRIDLQLEGTGPLPDYLPRGMLLVDDTALLRRLAEALEWIAVNSAGVSPLAVAIFHPHLAKIGNAIISHELTLKYQSDDQDKLRVISQACGSSLTYVWGPPGTGKTHLIAELIAELLKRGERILVSSHTHAAVDQVIYASVKEKGPLAGIPLVSEGKIIRIGQTTDKRVPDSVRLAKVLEAKAQDMQARVLELEKQVQPLSDRLTACEERIGRWEQLAQITSKLEETRAAVMNAEIAYRRAQWFIDESPRTLHQRRKDLDRAQRAWFFRETKVQRARGALRVAEEDAQTAKLRLQDAETTRAAGRIRVIAFEEELAEARAALSGVPALQALKMEQASLESQIQPVLAEISNLNDKIAQLQREIITDARVIFCTLTKNYMGKELDDQEFDVVIADEISMALPPLLFLAARRARSRVVLAGDFLQLPPIIRSDAKISNERLREDAFHLSGIVIGRTVQDSKVLTSLKTQRRMAQSIAAAARHLAYEGAGLRLEDHTSVRNRRAPGWLDFLGENALVIIDTSDLHCWSGKQPGSLSRFNFYSANLAVELAGMAAAGYSAPPGDERPIGIVTPYAAQRRLLMRQVQALDLTKWVTAGTVHTFQGSEADFIIIDSVLDEPYWSSRLTTPACLNEVLRDLNVAVTRAKYKLAFIGSSEWLNQHARPASALGRLWAFLKDNADLVSAFEFVGQGFAQRVMEVRGEAAWRVPESPKSGLPLHELLDENSFFGRFIQDLQTAQRSIFGLVPFFGEYRWPRIEPYFRAALERGVEVTLMTPPVAEAQNPEYVEKAIQTLRDLGAAVIASSGLHGKDIVIDERILYTGSLNWASHRGRAEIMHRTEDSGVANLELDFIQAKHIRSAILRDDRKSRTCPECGGPTHVVNQRKQAFFDIRQPMKIGCVRYQETGCNYLRDIDERPPYITPPRCQKDGRTKYRRVRRGRGEFWQCPKHPKECLTERVVPGDQG
jgi:predicted nuclease with TOPRIM domain